MTTFILLFFFQIKHFLVDWVFQTEYQAKTKGIYFHIGGIMHSFQHALASFIILSFVDPSKGLILATVDGILHYHIDWIKQNLSSLWKLTPSDKRFWIFIGADQLLHQLTYLLMIYLLIQK